MMKILDLKDLNHYSENSCVTLGFFDGIHLGHQAILNTLVNKAKINNLKSVVITFDDSVLQLFKMSKNIISTADKLSYLSELGVDYVLLLKTSDNFMGLSAIEFKKQVLDKLNCKVLVSGNDLSFARKKEGNVNFLKENSNYEINIVDDVYVDFNKISSTYIRSLLLDGKVDKVNKLLYKPYSITSNVIEGFKIGRTIGFKTANINVTSSCYLLKHGVYFGKIIIEDKEYKTMVNVGINPTINSNEDLKVEAHILDFDLDVYYKYVKLIPEKYYREEVKFEKLEDLKNQLQIDLINLRSY